MARQENFSDGYERVREPRFESIQQQGNRNFQATSVLDNIMPNQNGIGTSDLQRRMMGIQSSAIGSAESTFDKRLWISHREPSNRAKTVSKEQQ